MTKTTTTTKTCGPGPSRRRLLGLGLSVPALLLGSGCASQAVPTRYHQLTGAAPVPAAQPVRGELVVDAVRVPEALDRPQFVMRQGATQVRVLDDQRWVSPLPDQLTRALVGDLQAELPQAWVRAGDAASVGGLEAGAVRLVLRVDVEHLHLGPGTQVALQAAWALLDARERVLLRERSLLRLDMAEPGPQGVAPAVSQAVARFAAEVAVRVRERLKG